MTSTCPTCNKAVDPLRSRFVRVLQGKVVAYCSAACAPAQSAVSAEAATVISPASGVPAHIPTPATGIPSRSTPASGVASRSTPASGVASRSTPASGVASRSTPASGVASRSTPASGVASRSTPPAGVTAHPRTPVSGVPAGPPQPLTPEHGIPINLDSGPVIEIVHEPSSGVATSAPDARHARETPRARHPDEIAISEFWTADKERSGAVRSAGEPGSTPVAPASGRTGHDDTLDRWTTDTGDRDHRGRPISEAAAGRPASRIRLVLLILTLLAAGGVLAYQYLLRNNLAAATHMPPPAASIASGRVVDPPAPVEPAPTLDVAAAVERARAVLDASLTSNSQRLQRIAAAALARTQDPEAREVLAAHIGRSGARAGERGELGDVARLDLAYSLARAGDARGSDVLAAALGAQRGEARDEAARLLALLGDRRAVPRLVALLAVSQRRLGAAEHLAHLAEPRAIKVLEQIQGSTKASGDDRTRATIALGVAGQAAVAPALRGMLDDPHFNAFAAAALVELADGAARPVLEQQLASPSLRARAARALRRLDPALDPRPLLPRLLDVLDTGRDRDQVHAAEAILLLAGPVAWSAHP
jgi:HEAT repeat protein